MQTQQQMQTQATTVMRKFWNIEVNNNNSNADLVLYGVIGSDELWDDITDQNFREDIQSIGNVDTINLHINSPGGGVFSAIAIANTIKNHKATTIANIDGLAASAATIITSACDIVKMPKNALFMIHNPLTIAYGDKQELEKTIELLDKTKDIIIDTYCQKTNLSKDKISKLMDNETWMSAEEAQAFGFIDEVVDNSVDRLSVDNRLIVNNLCFDMSNFKNFKGGENVKNIEEVVLEIVDGVEAKEEVVNTDNTEEVTEEVAETVAEITDNETVTDNADKTILNVSDFQEKYPELFEEIVNNAKSEERNKLQESEEVNKTSNLAKLENMKNETKETKVDANANTGVPVKEAKMMGTSINSVIGFMNKKFKEEHNG